MIYKNLKKQDALSTDKFSINWKNKLIIAGPCTFENYEELYNIAIKLKEHGINFLRAGAYKMRTNPYDFQGLKEEGINILLRIQKELGMHIVTEFTTIEQIKKYGKKVDIIQIGARNMYNYELLEAAGKTNTPILLKRAFSASYKEWILAAEYILKTGNNKVILCERGIRNNCSTETRNVLDIQAIPYIKKNTNFPIIIDPSHASGHSYMVTPMSKAALAAEADGLLIEVHENPEKSLCDKNQTIDFNTLEEILEFKDKYEKIK